MHDNINDNEAPRSDARGEPRSDARREPDAHGQAAMLLVESLIHGLIARSAISVVDAIEIVEVAVEVKAEIAADLGESLATLDRSLTILRSISMSLMQENPDG